MNYTLDHLYFFNVGPEKKRFSFGILFTIRFGLPPQNVHETFHQRP